MARGRLISRTLGSSRKFHALLGAGGKLGEFCQVLFPLIVANTDDFGRMPGDAFTVKNVVFPSSPRAERDFDAALNAMHRTRILTRYVVNGEEYLQVADFDAHQPNLHKRTASKFPEIPGDSGKVPEVPPESNLTEQNRTKENRTEPKAPAEPRAALTREADALFEQFWAAYPKKKSKDDARRAWNKRRPDQALLDVMLAAIAVQRRTHDWQKEGGQFVPYPARWLNAAMWTDAVDVDVAAETARVGGERDMAWWHDCQRDHRGDCGSEYKHDLRVRLEAMRKSDLVEA